MLSQYGDGTVVTDSAAYHGVKVYVDFIEIDEEEGLALNHSTFTSAPSMQDFISDILNYEKNALVSDYDFLSSRPPNYINSYQLISVQSPVTLKLVDGEGNTLGVVDGEIVEEIPGGSYLELGAGKYAIIPAEVDYELLLVGEADGVYTITIDAVSPEGETTSLFFQEATSTPVLQQQIQKTDDGFMVTDLTGFEESVSAEVTSTVSRRVSSRGVVPKVAGASIGTPYTHCGMNGVLILCTATWQSGGESRYIVVRYDRISGQYYFLVN